MFKCLHICSKISVNPLYVKALFVYLCRLKTVNMKTLKSKTIQSFVGIGIALLLFSCGKNKEKTALVDEDHAMVVADEIST